jgi:hypothetical protein
MEPLELFPAPQPPNPILHITIPVIRALIIANPLHTSKSNFSYSQPITHTNLPSFIPLYLQAYVNCYANGAVLEHTPSDEEIVRIHNDPAILSFWNNVAAYPIS